MQCHNEPSRGEQQAVANTHIYIHKHAHIENTRYNDLEHYCSRCVSQIYTSFYWGGLHHSSFPLGAAVI